MVVLINKPNIEDVDINLGRTNNKINTTINGDISIIGAINANIRMNISINGSGNNGIEDAIIGGIDAIIGAIRSSCLSTNHNKPNNP